jgi:hypothetical protein
MRIMRYTLYTVISKRFMKIHREKRKGLKVKRIILILAVKLSCQVNNNNNLFCMVSTYKANKQHINANKQ